VPFDPFKRHRRSIRLQQHDYTSPGAYYITIDTHDRMHLFGEIVNGEMHLNEWGRIANDEWLKTPSIRPETAWDEFKIMPNHMHAIVAIIECGNGFVGAHACPRACPEQSEGEQGGSGFLEPPWSRSGGPCAPTANRTIVGIIDRRIQIRRHRPHQPNSQHPRCPRMATQLLGTHRPE
jgi:hypothetical protein